MSEHAAAHASVHQLNHAVMYVYIMQRTQISLTEHDRNLLDAEAARTGHSISALIRRAIEHTYGSQRSAEQDLDAINAALGAWQGRELDGEAYVDAIRSAHRWPEWSAQ